MVRWRLSRSSALTRWPEAAKAIAVWTAVVDLPVPPFSLAKMMKCGWLIDPPKALAVLIFAPARAQARPSRWSIGGAVRVQIIRRLEELGAALDELRHDGPLALVPTMGALHAGHLALIAAAKAQATRVAATIFVNPTQFGPGEDLDRYPRREQADADMLAAAGCDLLWLPAVADVSPERVAH